MDLSFQRFDKAETVTVLPSDLAVLMVGIAARQAASPTAVFLSQIAAMPFESSLLQPAHGAFNAPVSRLLARWQEE